MTQNVELYYTAPSQEVFDEVKNAAIELRNTYDNEYGYVDEKVWRIKDIENIRDNMMYIVAMFDVHNQRKLLLTLSDDAIAAIASRLDLHYLLLYM